MVNLSWGSWRCRMILRWPICFSSWTLPWRLKHPWGLRFWQKTCKSYSCFWQTSRVIGYRYLNAYCLQNRIIFLPCENKIATLKQINMFSTFIISLHRSYWIILPCNDISFLKHCRSRRHRILFSLTMHNICRENLNFMPKSVVD